MEDIKFLEIIVKNLVKKPDEVVISEVLEPDGVLLKLRVHKSDMGLIIGKQGITSSAIKWIVKTGGYNHDRKVNLLIEEPI